jgi:hypothetical protein
MTLPSEELRALSNTRRFLRWILCEARAKDLRIKDLRDRAASCLRHYPWESTLMEKWSDEVCEHGDDRRFCRECKK